MQLRALRYFSQVARSASLREAAEKLFVTATAVSRQIEILEHYYGAALVERSPRGIKLTREGEFLAQAIHATLTELDSVKDKIAASNSIVSGSVRLCAAESLMSSFIAPAIAGFSALHPRVTFEIETGSAPHIAAELLAGRADVALTFYLPVSADLQITHSCELQHKVVMSHQHPLAVKSSLTLKEVAQYPLCIPSENFAVRQLMESAARREGLTFDIRYVASSLDVQKRLAVLGLALIIQPQLNVNDSTDHDQLIAVSLADPVMGRVKVDLCLPRQRNLSMATRLFHQQLAAIVVRQNG